MKLPLFLSQRRAIVALRVLVAAGVLSATTQIPRVLAAPNSANRGAQNRSVMKRVAVSRAPILIGLVYGDGFDLVGAHHVSHGWLNAEKSHDLFRSGQRFSLLGLNSAPENAIIGKVTRDDRLPENFYASIANRGQNAPQRLAIFGAKSRVMPRRLQKLNVNSGVYKRAIAKVLQQRGVRVLEAKIAQSYRIDLNGDGRKEVLLTAQSNAKMGKQPFAHRGDYALAAVRFVVNGRVKTQVLDADIYTRDELRGAAAVSKFEFLTCADLNGDGKMEIALASRYYEGNSVAIYTFDGRNFKRVLQFGTGA